MRIEHRRGLGERQTIHGTVGDVWPLYPVIKNRYVGGAKSAGETTRYRERMRRSRKHLKVDGAIDIAR